MAPLLAMYAPDELPDAKVLQAMAQRVGLWALVQSASELARRYGYERFRVRIISPDSVSARWQLELCLKARDIKNPKAVVDAFNYGGETDLDEALLTWRTQLAVAPVVEQLPDSFHHGVVDQWVDPAQVETLRSTILGAPAVALWRKQASQSQGDALPATPKHKRPRP